MPRARSTWTSPIRAAFEAAKDATLAAFGRSRHPGQQRRHRRARRPRCAQYPLEELQATMRVNLDGPFNCCHALVPGMIAQNYGRIVNIASIAGKEGNPNASAYSAS
jgi:3-oxoacyl-[acyl-carrier protein] reductase